MRRMIACGRVPRRLVYEYARRRGVDADLMLRYDRWLRFYSALHLPVSLLKPFACLDTVRTWRACIDDLLVMYCLLEIPLGKPVNFTQIDNAVEESLVNNRVAVLVHGRLAREKELASKHEDVVKVLDNEFSERYALYQSFSLVGDMGCYAHRARIVFWQNPDDPGGRLTDLLKEEINRKVN